MGREIIEPCTEARVDVFFQHIGAGIDMRIGVVDAEPVSHRCPPCASTQPFFASMPEQRHEVIALAAWCWTPQPGRVGLSRLILDPQGPVSAHLRHRWKLRRRSAVGAETDRSVRAAGSAEPAPKETLAARSGTA